MRMQNSRWSLEPTVLKVGSTKEGDVLIGSKCKICGRYFFPQRKRCGYCAEPTTEVLELSKEGMLSSYSLSTKKPKYSLIEPPYILGEVEIPEGILIYTVISTKSPGELKIGQRVKLDTVEIKKDEVGRSIIAYCFTPVE
jgi:uncharacterized OB-fold protein